MRFQLGEVPPYGTWFFFCFLVCVMATAKSQREGFLSGRRNRASFITGLLQVFSFFATLFGDEISLKEQGRREGNEEMRKRGKKEESKDGLK